MTDYDSALLRKFTVELEATTERVAIALEQAERKGLSRALVALEAARSEYIDPEAKHVVSHCIFRVRSLLEALVDGPATPGEPIP